METGLCDVGNSYFPGEGMVVNMLPSGAMGIVVSNVDDSEGISHIEARGSGMSPLSVPVPT